MISFQIIDYRDYHIEEVEDSEGSDSSTNSPLKYVIRLFGRTALNDPVYPDRSVCCSVLNMTPFFFIKMPYGWSDIKAKNLYTHLKERSKGELIDYKIITKQDFDKFHANDKCKFIQLIFRTAKAMKSMVYYLRPSEERNLPYILGKRQKFDLYESNIDPIIKFMHIKGLQGCAWAKVSEDKVEHSENSICDLDFECDWRDVFVDKENSQTYSRLRILSYDIEVFSSDPNGGFPQAWRDGDTIIQIGLTYNYYLNSNCYRKQIISLNTCNPIEGAEVICVRTERELLQKFVSLIQEEDPDIICGYNIFGFDNKYLYDRAKKISTSFESVFSQWSRLRDHHCAFDEKGKKLSSSALGDNIMFYYESHGRIQIDLLKVVQRDFNLENYKLDFVSSYFNQNSIQNLNGYTFESPNLSGLEVGAFFHVKTIDKTSGVEDLEHEKYKVTSLEGKCVRYEGGLIDYDTTLYNLKWTMAKDDLPPRKIFEYFLLDEEHRTIVAKYCLKDCILVNFLMEKLDVVSNNIAMSNVCWVPLYYIFTRGQGIKSFSLVAQQCRLDGFLIPALKKDDFTSQKFRGSDEEYDLIEAPFCTNSNCSYHEPRETKYTVKEFKETKERVCPHCNVIQYYTDYEGARVYEPEPGVYWEPVTVLDYASLYPRSIISRNMSWETQVFDAKYDNLADYKYYDVSYKDSRGNTINCRFAQNKDRTLGIIPKILLNLLEERDATKKKMKGEKDSFKKKILDGHQLALKITANSLYGQLGAITSPVYRKDIAACTTSVGQQMLGIAQTFVEDKFVPILDSIDTIEDLRERLPHLKSVDEEWELVRNIKENYTMKPKVIYGDSVTADTPLLLRKNGLIYIKTIDSISSDWSPYDEFKSDDLTLRNKEQSTTDFEVWTNGKWSKIVRVIRHATDKKIYRINTHQGVVDVTEDHSLIDEDMNLLKPYNCICNKTRLLQSYPGDFDNNHSANLKEVLDAFECGVSFNGEVPDFILNSSREIRLHYITGFYLTNLNNNKKIEFSCRGKVGSAQVYYLFKSLGYSCSIKSQGDIYTITCHEDEPIKDYNIIKKIELQEQKYPYVYDLETEEGIFQAGVGEIIVKNTDSVFVNLQMRNKADEVETDREARVRCMKIGMLAGDLIKAELDYPHDLEYDKTFHPWLVVCKKKYAGPKYEEDPDKFSMTYMGIVLKRRDNAKIVKKVCGGILNILLKEKDYIKVKKYTSDMLQQVIDSKFDISYFITTKTLRGSYKGKKLKGDKTGQAGEAGTWNWDDVECSVAHVRLCQRLKARDPGSAPQVNDRVSFVQVCIPETKKKTLQGDKIEEASYVLEKKLEIDYGYYISNQVMVPACQFLDLIMKNSADKLFKPVLDELEFRRNNRTRILEKLKKDTSNSEFTVSF